MNLRTLECPICKLDAQSRTGGEEVNIQCLRCGHFTISGSTEAILDQTDAQPLVSAWLRERNLLGVEIPLITSNVISDLKENAPAYSPLEKQRRLLRGIQLLSGYPGEQINLMPDTDASLSWSENENESRYYIKSLVERELLEFISERGRTFKDQILPVVITAKGWEHLENSDANYQSKTQAFIAMSFDPALYHLYSDAIAPAVEAAGYLPYRVDAEPHLDRIDAKIISEIKNSRFLVADVTQQKSGVYYEAGFAHGMGIPVIWSVNSKDLGNVHFDTRQYNHIVWESTEQLKEKIYDSVLANIGKR